MKHSVILLSLIIVFCNDLIASKRDFRGLFGNYRRERFIENEANATDFGVELLLSTLMPVSPIIKSSEGGTPAVLQYAAFFNYELMFTLSLAYRWQASLSIGHYSYDTRKENEVYQDPTKKLPLFHQFEMEAVPAMLGIRYRFSTDDIVPYFGLAGGMSYVRRKAFYDYKEDSFKQTHQTVAVGEVVTGLEFYFTSRAGIRLEVAALYFALPEDKFDPSAATLPVFYFQSNPWSVRYASGVFVLF